MVPITLSLTVHPADWDAESYVLSHPPQPTPTGRPAVLTPANAAGSSRGHTLQARGSLGTSDVTLSVFAIKRTGDSARVRGLRAEDMPGGSTELYDIVLQEQVRQGYSLLWPPCHADSPNVDVVAD
jgi:hypothetical protein